MLKKDKAKVTDEIWDDDRIASFLRHPIDPNSQASSDFQLLIHAYQSMRPQDFSRFIRLFVEEGFNIDALNAQDHSMVDYLSSHRHGIEFIKILTENGARAPRVPPYESKPPQK